MMMPTQVLQIADIPEQHGIALMRLDMIDLCAGYRQTLGLAHRTERMFGTKLAGELAPTPRVVQLRPLLGSGRHGYASSRAGQTM